MDLRKRYHDIINEYPEFITAKQFRKICGINRRTASAVFQNGIVKFEVVQGKLPIQYSIRLLDALEYKWLREKRSGVTISNPDKAKHYYEKKLVEHDDVIPTDTVHAITGYSSKTVYNWISGGKLPAVRIGAKLLIVKDELIEFLAGANYNQTAKKSEQHMFDIEQMKQVLSSNRDL